MLPLFAAMSTTVMVLIGVGVVVLLLIMFFVGIYNNLVALRNRYKNGFSQIDVQLKTPLRPDPQPGRGRQGLHDARARDPGSRHQRPQRGRQRQPEGRPATPATRSPCSA